MIRQWLTVGIILLFIGIAIAPTINFNTVKASTDDDLVEVTTQACGIQGYKDTTVKLTREQYQNLEEYLVEFRTRLNQTTTREEAVPIFKEAMVELDKYGLLPRGMSIEKAQKLVIGGFQSQRINKILEKFIRKYDKSVSDNRNFCCLIYGKDSVPITSQRFLSHMLCSLLLPLIYINPALFALFNDLLIFIATAILMYIPIHMLITIFMGSYEWMSETFNPNKGFINSYGLLGVKKYNGSIYGAIPLLPQIIIGWDFGGYSFPAVIGFTGITIINFKGLVMENITYLGSALWIDVSSEPPEYVNESRILKRDHLNLSEMMI